MGHFLTSEGFGAGMTSAVESNHDVMPVCEDIANTAGAQARWQGQGRIPCLAGPCDIGGVDAVDGQIDVEVDGAHTRWQGNHQGHALHC